MKHQAQELSPLPHIPEATAAMIAHAGLTVPPSGRFKRGRLDTLLRRNGVLPGRREWLIAQLRLDDLLV